MIRERTLQRMNLIPATFNMHCAPAWPGRAVWLEQTAKYSAVGILNTLLDATLYLLLTHWLGLAGWRVLAKGISYSVGTVNSFHWNRTWTFHSGASTGSAFALFVLASLVAVGINAGLMGLGLHMFNQSEVPALIMATGLTLVFNFCVSKFVIFKR
ncbi:MAG TPA: GtrA family protein [Chloroflexota bacterium]|nr:GtrA family protein [Chloroflexota bacterium]